MEWADTIDSGADTIKPIKLNQASLKPITAWNLFLVIFWDVS